MPEEKQKKVVEEDFEDVDAWLSEWLLDQEE